MVQGVPGGRQKAARRRHRPEASSDEVKMLRAEARQLKEVLAEVTLENRLVKKT
jgi:hypothetical protein